MGLNTVRFPKSINTGNASAIESLFVPALREATQYNVAVAYFTSGWISDAAPGLSEFVSRGGTMKWIISPDLKQEDLDAINFAESDEERGRIVDTHIENLFSKMKYEPREALKWMIADNILDIRFAIPRQLSSGIFHAKIGFFVDDHENRVAFSGSYNQTAGANHNWERIDIYDSKEEPERTGMVVSDWMKLWNNQDHHCRVFKASEITITKIKNSISTSRPYRVSFSKKEPTSAIKLRDYQEVAIEKWFDNQGAGIFLMATGSGKTITALTLISRFFERVKGKSARLVVVIAVPYRHLLDQWTVEADAFGLDVIKCYESKSKWLPEAKAALSDLNIGIKNLVVLGTTYTTLSKPEFQDICAGISFPILFIGDEIHNAAEGNAHLMLPSAAKFRLGLTATPEKTQEPGFATQNLESYFGKVLFEFDIQEAISKGYLTPYNYYPVLCRMNQEEFDEYVELSQRIGNLIASGKNSDDDGLKSLLMRRARLVGDISEKYSNLADLIKEQSPLSKSIVYCGDYSVDEKTPIYKCAEIISSTRLLAQKFTHIESTKERADIIRRLSEGTINMVLAVRCLDEGVDIPSVDTAYILASSTSFRQFIQRRGRVLRLSPGKSKATIYDFIGCPPSFTYPTDAEKKAAHSLIRRELDRAKEFARISLNAHECLPIIKKLEELEAKYESR